MRFSAIHRIMVALGGAATMLSLVLIGSVGVSNAATETSFIHSEIRVIPGRSRIFL